MFLSPIEHSKIEVNRNRDARRDRAVIYFRLVLWQLRVFCFCEFRSFHVQFAGVLIAHNSRES